MGAKVTVLGAGSWGTALAVHLARVGHDVRLWARDADFAATLSAARENPAADFASDFRRTPHLADRQRGARRYRRRE